MSLAALFFDLRFRLAALAVAVAPLTGCMISPREGDVIPSKTSSIHCMGATQLPNDMIHVEAWNILTNRWDVLKHAYTGTGAVSAHGSNWYVWGTSVKIPDWRYWQGDSKGTYVRIRSMRFDGPTDYEGENLYTFKTWEFEPSVGLLDFYQEHGHNQNYVKVYVE